MQRVAGRVPGREYEPPTVVHLVVFVHGVPKFIEEGYEVNWMRGRAAAVIDATRVHHMGLVIRRVEVHTIPAGREEYLCSEAIRALCVVHSWRLRLIRLAVVEASFVFVLA